MYAESLYVQFAPLQSVVSGGLDGEKKCIAVSEKNKCNILLKFLYIHCMYFLKPVVGCFSGINFLSDVMLHLYYVQSMGTP